MKVFCPTGGIIEPFSSSACLTVIQGRPVRASASQKAPAGLQTSAKSSGEMVAISNRQAQPFATALLTTADHPGLGSRDPIQTCPHGPCQNGVTAWRRAARVIAGFQCHHNGRGPGQSSGMRGRAQAPSLRHGPDPPFHGRRRPAISPARIQHDTAHWRIGRSRPTERLGCSEGLRKSSRNLLVRQFNSAQSLVHAALSIR